MPKDTTEHDGVADPDRICWTSVLNAADDRDMAMCETAEARQQRVWSGMELLADLMRDAAGPIDESGVPTTLHRSHAETFSDLLTAVAIVQQNRDRIEAARKVLGPKFRERLESELASLARSVLSEADRLKDLAAAIRRG